MGLCSETSQQPQEPLGTETFLRRGREREVGQGRKPTGFLASRPPEPALKRPPEALGGRGREVAAAGLLNLWLFLFPLWDKKLRLHSDNPRGAVAIPQVTKLSEVRR